MIIEKIILVLIFFFISCSPTNLQNAGDPNSISGNLTKLLLDINSENARRANSGATNSDANVENSNTQSTSSTQPTYTVTIRVNNLAGASGTASAQFTLNGGTAETVSTTGNAVRDLTFPSRVASGDPYLISVASHPGIGYRFCNIPVSAGAMPANDLIVMVYCYGTLPSGGQSLTVGNTVGANAVLGINLDGNPGSSVFVNVGITGTAYAFDDPPLSTATSLVFTIANFSVAQNVPVYRVQTGMSANMNLTHGFAPFTQFALVSVTP
jgi:hypothetical protein